MAPVVFEDFDGFPCAMDCSREPALREGMLEMVREYEHRRRYGEARLSGLLKAFLAQAAQAAAHSGPGLEAETGRNGGEITAYIHAHYAEDLSIEQLARQFYLSPYHLSHIFRQKTGYSLKQYVLRRRIGEAQMRLVNAQDSVQTISEAVGFADASYFSRIFSKYVGLTPTEYRKFRIGP